MNSLLFTINNNLVLIFNPITGGYCLANVISLENLKMIRIIMLAPRNPQGLDNPVFLGPRAIWAYNKCNHMFGKKIFRRAGLA